MKRLAIVTTHPIQYNAPLFKLLTERSNISLKVFYTWGEGCIKNKYDPGFDKIINWDIPLLEGYDYAWVTNTSKNPGSHHFRGIQNPTLIDDIQSYDPDAILIYGWSFKSHLRVMRYFKGKVKVLFRGDSTLLDDSPEFSLKKTFRHFILQQVYKYVDTALFCGESNKAYFLTNGLTPNKLVYAPHAIDNHRFMNNDETFSNEAALWRDQIGISSTSKVFLFAGKLEQKKNIGLLIESFLRLNKQDTALLIAGNGPSESHLRTLSNGSKNIVFLPFQNQSKMPVLYRVGDVFILPSQGPGETWGLAVNEAMACGKAVIVSNKCGCAADLVKSEANGFIFKSECIDSLTEKLRKIIAKDLKSCGETSRQIIKGFSFEKICEAIEASV